MSTTTSVPRDVVVALDISNTMRGNKLNEARRAVLTVLEKLSVKDNVSLYICRLFLVKLFFLITKRRILVLIYENIHLFDTGLLNFIKI